MNIEINSVWRAIRAWWRDESRWMGSECDGVDRIASDVFR